MKCKKCNRTAEIDGFCSLCFPKVILTRVSKHLRASILHDEPDEKLVITVDDELAEHFIQKTLKRPFVIRKNRSKKSGEIRILSWTADDLAEWFLGKISGKDTKREEGILLFENVLSRELKTYAHLTGLKYEPRKTPLLDKWGSLKKRDDAMVLGLRKTINAWSK